VSKELDYQELFQRVARPGEEFDDDWVEEIQEVMHEEGRTVAREWCPAGITLPSVVVLFRGLFIASDEVCSYGPFDTFAEAAAAIQFPFNPETSDIWVAPEFDDGSVAAARSALGARRQE
jgi:hypothetical protein